MTVDLFKSFVGTLRVRVQAILGGIGKCVYRGLELAYIYALVLVFQIKDLVVLFYREYLTHPLVQILLCAFGCVWCYSVYVDHSLHQPAWTGPIAIQLTLWSGHHMIDSILEGLAEREREKSSMGGGMMW